MMSQPYIMALQYRHNFSFYGFLLSFGCLLLNFALACEMVIICRRNEQHSAYLTAEGTGIKPVQCSIILGVLAVYIRNEIGTGKRKSSRRVFAPTLLNQKIKKSDTLSKMIVFVGLSPFFNEYFLLYEKLAGIFTCLLLCLELRSAQPNKLTVSIKIRIQSTQCTEIFKYLATINPFSNHFRHTLPLSHTKTIFQFNVL